MIHKVQSLDEAAKSSKFKPSFPKKSKNLFKEGTKLLVYKGLIRWSLMAVLPFVVLAVISSQIRQTDSTQTIEVPKNFCELDARDKCTDGKCIRYDPKKFAKSPSIMTYFPGGRLGNMLTTYLTLYWLKLEFGYDTYYEKEAYYFLDKIFTNINGTVSVLEDSLCDWHQFGFRKYEGDVELLGTDSWMTGQAIEIYIAKENFMRHEIQGGRKFYKKFKKQSLEALTFKPHIQSYADINLRNIAKKVGKKPEKITYVGIHNRRTDYLEFRRKRLKLDNLYEDYFEDAMEYFREEYWDTTVVFVYVSDDMKWGRKNLKDSKNLFFLGCGSGNDLDCIAKDFALLGSCNHTITTHGTYGHWAAYFAGGEIYTEYGSIIPGTL